MLKMMNSAGRLLAVLVFVLPASSALADFPASFSTFISQCPNPPAPFIPPGGLTLPAQPTCQAAVDAAYAFLESRCPKIFPGATCSPDGSGKNLECCTDGNSQGGTTIVARIRGFCPEGQDSWPNPPYGTMCVERAPCLQCNLGPPPCPSGGCEGNPVNPSIGNKFEVETDYVGSGPFPLRFMRYYNAREVGDAEAGSKLGHKWTQTYGRRLSYNAAVEPIHFVAAIREDAKVLRFSGAPSFPGGPTVTERLERTGAGWKLTNRQDETELYDSTGKLTSITNRAGLTQTLAYDAAGRLSTVTDPFGRSLAFTYNGVDRIQSMTTPAGTYQYAYGSPSDSLTGVTYPDTRTRSYLYKPPACFEPKMGLLEGIVDENGDRFATFAYDCDGKATSTERAGGAGRVRFGNNNTQGIWDVTVARFISETQSVSRNYRYQSVSGTSVHTAVQGAPCPSCGNPVSTYDTGGNLASSTDWIGNRANYTYDLTRNLETSRTEGLTSAGGATAQTRTITTQWHPSLRLVKRVAEPLRITTYTYNGDGGASCGFMSDGATLVQGVLCSKSIQATTDASGASGFGGAPAGTPRTWTYTYNANGQVLTMDGPRTDVADTTTYTYYTNNDADLGKRGNVATITNAAGHTTSITAYNAHGQPLTIVDPNGLTTALAHDARQRLTSRTVGGETTTYTYDNAGQLTKVTLPDLSFLSYSYDPAHRLTGMQDNLGNRITYTLDFMGNRTQEEVRDPANALAQTRSRIYSDINRLFREIGASGQTTEYAYDNQGNVTSVKDPLNRITANQYDALNRLRQVTDPATGVTQYAYNGLDALTQVTDPRSLVTGYAVDGLGNLNQQVSPDTGTTTNTYDVAGNLLTQTDAKGQVTTYTYDALNRVTQIGFHDGAKQVYAYDQGVNSLGRLSSITERNPANEVTNVIAYAYAPHGRVTSETRTVAGVQYVLGYSYDSAGRLSGLTYPSGRTVAYAFDALGRVNQVTTTKSIQSQIVVQNVAYHPFGGVKGFTLGNGQSYTRSIDQDGRIASYTLGATQYAIGYDAASRIAFISDLGNLANSNTYGYDALDRLTSAILPTTPFAYGYDAVGNRLSKTVGSGTESYTYSTTSNRLATLTPSSGPSRTFGFDPNGSTVNDGQNSYVYDTRGRMVQATSAIGATSYQVNALGQRIRKTNSATDTVFHYDTRGKLIAETDPGGTLKREYLYLGDIPVAVVAQ